MKDKDKTKEQLINELVEMRQRITELKTSEAELIRTEEELREAHEELEQTKQYLERLIESSPDAIVSTDQEGAVTFFSLGAETLLGYEQEEILGQSVTLLYEDEDRAKEVMLQMRESGGIVAGFETLLRAKDGSLIPALISASILYDEDGHEAGTVGFNKDLRERKKGEEALRESEERFRFVTESAIDAIISADGRGNIISWNKGAMTIFGYEEDEVLGKPLTFLMPQRYKEPHRRGLERMSSTGEARVIGKTVELHGLRKDGTEFPLELSLSTWRKGESQFYSGIIRDITERKQAEETMRLANERMRQQLETARIIQQSFLPGQLPGADDPRYSLAAANYPAASVGGDYYDVIELGRNRLALVLGDVSGKGVPGAIYMARLVSDFRFLVEPHDDSPAETLTALNRLLQDRGQPGMFVTLLYLTLDLDTGVVTFANAGHLPLLIRRAIGKVETVVGDAGPPLGIIDNIAYNDSFLSLQPGEDMLLYTDGVTEAMNAAREQFTEERLLEILLRTHPRLENIINTVTEEVKTFTGDATSNDDLTLLAARWEGEDPRMF